MDSDGVGPASSPPARVGFLMDLIAGHVTNLRNLQSVDAREAGIEPVWCEIDYYRPGGTLERWRERWAPFVPTYFSGNLRGTIEMRRGLQRGPYDALFSNASVGIFFSRAFRTIPTIIDFDSTPKQRDAMPAYTPHPDSAPIAHLKWRVFRRMARSATLLQAWSSWAKRSVVDDYGIADHAVVVNPPGVNLDFWKATQASIAQRSRGSKRVLFVGADFERKGGGLLLDWYRQTAIARVELDIVTRDPIDVPEGVTVHRDLRPNSVELRDLFHRSDVFVLPSLAECFGIATVEAMAAGLCVINSDVGGARDIVVEGDNGYSVRAGDPRALGAALDAVLADDGLRRRMSVRSRQLAVERFDLARNARRTLAMLKTISGWSPEVRQRWVDGIGDLSAQHRAIDAAWSAAEVARGVEM